MTDREALKAGLAEALEILDELGIDRESRLAATILPFLLGSHAPPRPELGAAGGRATAPAVAADEDSTRDSESGMARLSEWSGVDELVLEDAIYEQDDQIYLQVNTDRLPDTKAGVQRALGYAYLAVMRQGFDMNDVPVDHFNNLLREYGALDQNVWSNLHSETGAFSRRGDRGAYTYRLTIQGLQRARQMVREVLGAD